MQTRNRDEGVEAIVGCQTISACVLAEQNPSKILENNRTHSWQKGPSHHYPFWRFSVLSHLQDQSSGRCSTDICAENTSHFHSDASTTAHLLPAAEICRYDLQNYSVLAFSIPQC
jgi:hypothetical protein